MSFLSSTFVCYPPSLWFLSIFFIIQILVPSVIACVVSYGEDGLDLSHSQGRLCPSYFFQAFGGYALAEPRLSSQRWLTSSLDLILLSVLLGVNQIQGFKVWDPGKFWMLDCGGSTTLLFQVSDLITDGVLLKFNLSQILLFDLGLLISCLRISMISCASFDCGFTFFSHGLSLS